MEEKSGRFRKKKINFSMVSNTLAHDKDISLKAKGLYLLIQSYITIDNFTLYKDFLMRNCLEGERAFNSAWKELKENGYLKQYKMREGSTHFYYEYELLDEPEKENSLDCHFVPLQEEDVQEVRCTKGGQYNNTVQNNTIRNNINHIISKADVMEQIGASTFDVVDRPQVSEIATLMTDVLNTPGETIRVGKRDFPAEIVKERFKEIGKFHVEYVLECLRDAGEISNVKGYLTTMLFNAPATMVTYYQNKVRV